MSARSSVVFSLSLLALSACSPNGSLDFDVDDPAVVGAPARGASIERIALYQGVEIDLAEEGEVLDDHAVPVIEDRDAMMRVFVDLDSNFEERDLTAVLTIDGPGGQDFLEADLFASDDSDQADLDTTFNFEVPGELVSGDSSYRVTLQEQDFTSDFGGSNDANAFPFEDDTYAPIETERSDHVEIVVIPVRYNADGSGRIPDISELQLNRIRNKVLAAYPVSDVTITVGQTLDWDYQVAAYGNGWSNLLQQIAYMRDGATVDANTYYYGLFSPDSSMANYCSGGCVAGLSLLGSEYDEWSRASIGLGFQGEGTVDTLLHEVGHAHGREHAPCGLGGQQSDYNYPHTGASIGTWGYDIVTGELKNPSNTVDMMSYCSPLWVSDYTYDGMLDRVQALDMAARVLPPASFDPEWRSIAVDVDGSAMVGRTFTLNHVPAGEPTTVVVAGADGREVEVTGYLVEFDHLPGGIVMVPEREIAHRQLVEVQR